MDIENVDQWQKNPIKGTQGNDNPYYAMARHWVRFESSLNFGRNTSRF